MRLLPTIAVALLVVAGCGGGGGLSREEFVEKANANCKQRQQADIALQDRTEEEWAEDPDAGLRVIDRETRKQRELEPPDELAADWDRYLKLMDESNRISRRLRDAEPGDMDNDERSVLEGKARKAGVQARNVAEEMGLDVCGNAFY
jgi:hypothetical protein